MKTIYTNSKIQEWFKDYINTLCSKFGYNLALATKKLKTMILEIYSTVQNNVQNYEKTGYVYRSKHSDFHYLWPMFITKDRKWAFVYTFNENGIYLYDVIWSENIKTKQENKFYRKVIYITESQLRRIVHLLTA
jgi:hypothetical protein